MSELYHHGIKDQKWGVRRYQNEDGTYTEEGLARRRYQNNDGSYNAAGKKRYGIGLNGKMSSEGRKTFRADKKLYKLASKSKKNYDKSMELVKTRKDAKTFYGKDRLENAATDKHWKAEQQLARVNKLSQKYSKKFGYKQDSKMMSDLSKTSAKSNENFRPTTKGEKAASIAASVLVTAGTYAAAAYFGSPVYMIAMPRSSTFNYRLKDDVANVKVKDIYGSGNSPYQTDGTIKKK